LKNYSCIVSWLNFYLSYTIFGNQCKLFIIFVFAIKISYIILVWRLVLEFSIFILILFVIYELKSLKILSSEVILIFIRVKFAFNYSNIINEIASWILSIIICYWLVFSFRNQV
jgi:hypothetical protein